MKNSRIGKQGLVLLGCGKMGSAMLAGWLARGLPHTSVWVIDPKPSDWLRETGVHLNEDLPEAPGAVLVAVKPQMMAEALPTLKAMGGGTTVFVSVAAGVTIDTFERILGADTPIVRAMPNTPAAISRGITAIVGNATASADTLNEAEALLSAVGDVVRLTDEAQIDAVTGVSGSGPAYVFHMMEAMAAAGEAEGLPREMALQLDTATMAGACALAQESGEHPSELRKNVTSPNGTTQAALEVLMDEENGLPSLMRRAIGAATRRSKELASG
jgi:pyrroline-5-carboxylate reductase